MGDGGGTVPYIGSKIVLISKSDIRYEGLLGAVDTAASTVKLLQVRSLGTEDRKTDAVIPPSSTVYEYIIFRGADIKDLHVCESGSDSATAPQPSAATSATSASDPTPEPVAPSKPVAPAAAAWGANPSQARAAAETPAPAPAPAPRAQQTASKPRGARSQPGMPAATGNNTIETEFDIQAMLESFDKAFLMQEASSKVKASTAYDKSTSFFDTLDEEAADKGPKGGAAFRAEMRKNDVLTFGEDMLKEADRAARSRGGSRGRAGGKGGGGGGKGGKKGGGPGASVGYAHRGGPDGRSGKGGNGRGGGKGGDRRSKGDGRGRGGGGRGRGRGEGSTNGAAPVPVSVS